MTISEADVSKSKQWAKDFFEAVKSLEVALRLPKFCFGDTELNLPNGTSLKGYSKLEARLKSLASHISTLEYDLGNPYILPHKMRQPATIHLTFKGDPEQEVVSIAGSIIFHKAPGEKAMHVMNVFGDFSKVDEKLKRLKSPAQIS